MKVRELRKRLETSLGDAADDREVRILLQILADADDMSVAQFFARLRQPDEPSTSSPVERIVDSLRSAFWDDTAFETATDALAADRSATKPVLIDVFYKLFNRTRGVPKKASRAELLRLISDERRIIVRNEKMGRMLGRVVAAE